MIVNDIDIVKRHVVTIAQGEISFAELEEHVRASELWLKNDILGKSLAALADDTANTDLIEHCERIISLDAFSRAVPMLNLVLTQAGFAVTNNEKVAPASKERVADLRDSLNRQCAESVENLLIFLEATEKEEYIKAWEQSPSYSLFTDTFLPTFMLFKSYASYSEAVKSIYPSYRRDFAKLRGKMRSVMAGEISGAIGKDFVELLLSKIGTNSLEEPEKKILEPLRFALAAYTLGLMEDGDLFLTQSLSILKNDFSNMGDNFVDKSFSDRKIINLC